MLLELLYLPFFSKLHNSITACERDDIQYQVNEQIVTNCAERCTCGADGMFACVPQTCPPINGPTCIASGDPHYVSWDGLRFDFQGTCEYAMARPCTGNDFTVSANNDDCGGGRVSCVSGVRITLPNNNPNVIYIGRGSRLFIDGDAQPTFDQTYPSDPEINIRRTGGRVHVTLRQHGVYVYYDGGSTVRIQVSAQLRGTGMLCGLCGNYDGFANNDPRTAGALSCPGGGAIGKRSTTDAPCDNSPATVAEAEARCGVLRSSGIFSVCNDAVDPGPFIRDCQFDFCCGDADQREDFICGAYSDYASACAENGVQPSNWRSEFCRKFLYLNVLQFVPLHVTFKPF